jgi:phenol 2-monooxygenase
MAATWMAQTGIKTLVVEKKLSHTKVGHADGLESRTFEILDSFGIGAIWAEANRTIEVCLWVRHTPGRFKDLTLTSKC